MMVCEEDTQKVAKFLNAQFVGTMKGNKGKTFYFFQNEETGTEYMYSEKNLKELAKKL